MGQLTIDLDADTEARLRKVVEALGISTSQWIAALIREETSDESDKWPEEVMALAGSLPDFPEAAKDEGSTMLAYIVELTPDTNDTLLVTCPDLPEVTTFGEDKDDALLRAVDAIEEALAARIARRQDIPAPRQHAGGHAVILPVQTALKVALYQTMREQGLKKADLARRLSVHGPQVDRLFDLRHASRLDQLEAAFHSLGKRLDVRAV